MSRPTFVQADVFAADLPLGAFSLVYADPPYAGCRFKYARQNGSRQWGRNARQDFMRELVARVEELRSPDGVGAISMSTPELALLHRWWWQRFVRRWTGEHSRQSRRYNQRARLKGMRWHG